MEEIDIDTKGPMYMLEKKIYYVIIIQKINNIVYLYGELYYYNIRVLCDEIVIKIPIQKRYRRVRNVRVR